MTDGRLFDCPYIQQHRKRVPPFFEGAGEFRRFTDPTASKAAKAALSGSIFIFLDVRGKGLGGGCALRIRTLA